jgi:TatD DNase family protein
VLIDIHTHRQKKQIENEFFIFNQTNSFHELSLCEYISIGIHPWYIDSDWQKNIKLIEQHLSDPRVIAIGEAGVDLIKGPEMKLQMEVFQKQIEISEQYKKPLIIHCVKAFQEVIQIRKKSNATMPWIIHGFRSNIQIANQMIENGFYLSFGSAFLSRKNPQNAFINISLEKIFFETDDDASCRIKDLYIKASELLNMDLKSVEKQIQKNYSTAFLK